MERYEGSGKLAAFVAFAFALALAVGIAFALLDLPWWLNGLVVFVALMALAWVLRRRETGRWSYEVRRYTADLNGQEVELLFDERLAVLNRLTLIVDGEAVDRDTIFYGTKTLRSGSGAARVSVEVGSGWIGTCTGAVARSGDSERAMREAGPAASG